MLHWLRQWITVNHPRSFEDGLKHLGGPTHPALDKVEVDRVVLLVADPRETVLSLFRRGYSDAMPAKLASHHRTPREYSQFVADNRRSLSFEAFLEAGVDSFGFEQHWNDWSCRTHPRPTMIVRYEHIPEALPSLLEFLGLPGHLLSEFPAWTPRQSSLEQLSTLERTRLHHIYGDLANRIAAEPPWSIHQS